MKQMGELAGVPIEPNEQTRLLDACLQQPGVIGGGVPGGQSCHCCSFLYDDRSTAGGYDAIWLLVIDLGHPAPRSPVSAVEQVWQDWKEMNVSPLTAQESDVRGMRVEEFDKVPGLLKAVRG